MTATERLAYAVRMAVSSLRGGGWTGYAPNDGGEPSMGTVPGPGPAVRLRQAPGVLRASWRAAGEA